MKTTIESITAEANNPKRAGQNASNGWALFGENSRFKLFAVHTRFDAVQWFVTDAEKPAVDARGNSSPSVIRQEATKEAAVKGLA